MAIAFDAGSGAATNGTTSQTVSHTCTGSNLALVVAVTGDASADVITGCTYNGVAMTLHDKIQNNRWLYLFYLANPATGTHNIVASASSSVFIGVAAGSFTGVEQTGQPEATNKGSTSPRSVTTITDNAWTVLGAKDESGSIAAGAGSTLRANDGFGGGLTGLFSFGPKTPAGAHSMAWSGAAPTGEAGIEIAIAPAAVEAIAITTPVQYQSLQINGSNQASIPITGTYTGSPTAIEASFNGGAYATIDAAPAAGSYSGTLSNQAAGQGTLTVRFTNDTAVTATKTHITLTDVFVLAGDSRADGRLTNNQTYSGSGVVPRYRHDDAWGTGEPYDTDATGGSFGPLIANLYSALKSRPPAFITVGTGASDVAGSTNQWAKNNSSYAEMAAQIGSAGTAGVKAGLFLLGPNAVINASTLSQTTYNAALDQLASDFAADFTTAASSNPKIFVDVCGEVGTGSPPDRRAAEDNIRQAVIQAWGDNASIPGGPVLIDQDYTDDVHPLSDAQALVVAKRYWVAIENALYSGTYGRGPRVSGSITLDSSKKFITITFDRDLAAGTTYGGFRVEDSGTPATIVSAVRASSRRVVIEVSAALSAVGNVTVSFGSNDDAKGQTVPTTTALTLPDTNTITLPAEPFVDTAVTAEGAGVSQVDQISLSGDLTGWE